jgi:hypothetical protein
MGLLGSATVPLLRDSALRTMHERLDLYGIRYEHRKAENTLILKDTGTRILCRPLENFDRLRGTNLAFFGVDELTYVPEKAWLQLEARLRDPLATEKAGLSSFTPRGFDWVYKKFVKDPKPNYAAILAKPFENTWLDPEFYKGLIASYSHAFAQQEVFGAYLNIFSGRAYASFDSGDKGHIWKQSGENAKWMQPCHYRADRPLLFALDFNVNPATSVICQTVPQTPGVTPGSAIAGKHMQLNVLDECFLRDCNTQAHLEEFHNRALKKQVRGNRLHIVIYGDATGNRRQSSASKSDYAIIREFFTRMSDHYTFDIRVPNENPMVKDRVEAVNSLCLNGAGHKRLVVHERCKELIADLEQMAWATDSSGNLMMGQLNKKSPDRGHVSDALGYLVHFEFALRNSVGFKPLHVY